MFRGTSNTYGSRARKLSTSRPTSAVSRHATAGACSRTEPNPSAGSYTCCVSGTRPVPIIGTCRLLPFSLSSRFQFFHNLRHVSNQANDRSTTHRLEVTAKVCSSLYLATSTVAPKTFRTSIGGRQMSRITPPSTSTFVTANKLSQWFERRLLYR